MLELGFSFKEKIAGRYGMLQASLQSPGRSFMFGIDAGREIDKRIGASQV
jgi:hypothetical protein